MLKQRRDWMALGSTGVPKHAKQGAVQA